jgi:hypothetical protein
LKPNKYLREIAECFNLKRIGSVSFNTSTIRNKRKIEKKFGKKIDKLIDLIREYGT